MVASFGGGYRGSLVAREDFARMRHLLLIQESVCAIFFACVSILSLGATGVFHAYLGPPEDRKRRQFSEDVRRPCAGLVQPPIRPTVN